MGGLLPILRGGVDAVSAAAGHHCHRWAVPHHRHGASCCPPSRRVGNALGWGWDGERGRAEGGGRGELKNHFNNQRSEQKRRERRAPRHSHHGGGWRLPTSHPGSAAPIRHRQRGSADERGIIFHANNRRHRHRRVRARARAPPRGGDESSARDGRGCQGRRRVETTRPPAGKADG